MAVNEERTVSVSAHHSSPAYTKNISVPAYFSIAQTCEAIHATISEHLATQGTLTLVPNLSSIIIASGNFLRLGITIFDH